MQFSIKYRPQKFSEVLGQDVASRILKNSILMDRMPKAIVFSGVRGSGKTTLARIYAKALNCERFKELGDVCGECDSCKSIKSGTNLSVMELDAASDNGVDFIRNLSDIVVYKSMGKYRVIILDEAHMLTKQAQAALLKSLEELPPNNMFILVTTNPEKLEDTVVSRCLSMPLKTMSVEAIQRSIKHILDSEGKKYDEDFISVLSRYGDGALRDIQQILEMAVTVGEDRLTVEVLKDVPGILLPQQFRDLATVLVSGDIKFALEEVERWYYEGIDLELLFKEAIPVLIRDFSIFLSGSDLPYLSRLSSEGMRANMRLLYSQVQFIDKSWEETLVSMRGSNFKIAFMVFFIKIFSV